MEKARGLFRHRVRLLHNPLDPYERYECEWGYVPNSACGETIRILHVGEHQVPAHPSAILGSLQTCDYARAVFTAPRPDQPEGIPIDESLVASRTSRFHQLAESNRQWTLIQGHAALEWSLGSPAVMAAQMDQLIETFRLPNVRLGIVPAYVPARIQAHHGFDIYDRRAVCIGTWTATALTIDSHDIAEYEWLFGELEQLAVFDDEARTILARVAERYRQL